MSNPLYGRPGDVRNRNTLQTVTNRPAPIVPGPATPQGGRRRWVRSDVLVVNQEGAEGSGYTDVLARFQIDNPSVRLHIKAAIGFRPTTSEDTPFPAGGAAAWMWQLDAWDRNEQGLLIRTNNIFTNRPVPSSYEAITGNDQWRGVVTVPNAPGTGIAVDGNLWVIAMWEPAPGWNVDDEQLARIFQACHLRVTHGLIVTES